jgi:hypothetical protein
LFALFFYFSLGSKPQIIGEEDENPMVTTPLDSTIKNNAVYASYVYVRGTGYVLRDRRLVLLIGEDTAKLRRADAIKKIEKEVENYWKWRILFGERSIEQLLSKTGNTFENREEKEGERKNLFSRFFDIFKVADAVNVVRDTNKTCNCDDNLLLLSGPDLHLVNTILNPDSPIVGTGTGADVNEEAKNNDNLFSKSTLKRGQFLKLPPTEPQGGDGQSESFIVGIIDSGIDFGIIEKHGYQNSGSTNEVMITPKIESSLNYNFMNNSKEVIDSVKYKHGTNIARIIVKNTSSEKVKIVALKTFDQNKVGNLYDNLCAILYTIKYDMKVVNASWGASLKVSTSAFDEVLRRAKAANIVVVCSAGNQKQDIDLNPYYPACYADHSELGSHVLTVTSKKIVSNYKSNSDSNSICQNWSISGKKIDFTVKTNQDCQHGIPDASGSIIGSFQKGTSYATPYVTASVIEYLMVHPGGFSKSGYKSSIPASSDISNY